MALLANRKLMIEGKSYNPGDEVIVAREKAQQMIAQRLLRDTTFAGPKHCVVMRDGRIEGKPYKRGDLVDVAAIPNEKLSQLLEHRILNPA